LQEEKMSKEQGKILFGSLPYLKEFLRRYLLIFSPVLKDCGRNRQLLRQEACRYIPTCLRFFPITWRFLLRNK